MPKAHTPQPALTTFAAQLVRNADGTPARELQLLPDGEFVPTDGREMPASGVYRLNAQIAQRVIARAKSRANAFPIDYEHQTQLAEKNGQPAPAAGWYSGADLVYRPGLGLFAQNVGWTRRGQQYLADDEYRYQSATFWHDPQTGEVLDVVGAALTNSPGLDGLTSARLSALSAQGGYCFSHPSTTPSEDAMNPLLKALLEGLGLPESATVEQGVGALATLKAQAAQVGGLCAQITTLKATAPDPARFVPVETVTQLNGELATLRAQAAQVEIDQVLDQAKGEGKVASEVVERTWRDIGRADLAQLKALVAATPPNPALAGKRQTEGKDPAHASGGAGELNAAELAVLKASGISPEQYKASLAALAQG